MTIAYETRGHVATLILANPARHNAIGRAELDGIASALAELEASLDGEQDIRVLVITSSGGKSFCAGASLPEMNAGTMTGDDFQAMTDRIAGLPIPTLCAMNGNVFGGGAELALSCDFRIGIEGMRMRVPAAAIGLCYPLSGIRRFVQRLGVTRAKRALIGAETFEFDELVHIGFMERAVPVDLFDEAVHEAADRIATLAPLAVRAMKRVILDIEAGSLDEDAARELSRLCSESEDLREGFSAQREKRPPVFRGR